MKNIARIIHCPALWFCWMIFLPGCSGQREGDKEDKVKNPVPQGFIKPGTLSRDTLVVNNQSAVFFSADSVQLEKLRKVIPAGFFESITHDCFYQMRNARMVLKNEWPKVEIKEALNRRYLLFEKKGGSKVCIDLDKFDVCGVILFNGIKDPQITDMTNFQTELRYYFDF